MAIAVPSLVHLFTNHDDPARKEPTRSPSGVTLAIEAIFGCNTYLLLLARVHGVYIIVTFHFERCTRASGDASAGLNSCRDLAEV